MAKEEKVLIIDDELFSREYFQKILEKTNFSVKKPLMVPTGWVFSGDFHTIW